MTTRVVLLPTLAHAEHWRKRRVRSDAALGASSSLFGVTVTTFPAWISGLWELYGDGRTLIDGPLRAMLMRRALAQAAQVHGAEGSVSRGVVAVAAECMRRAAGTAQLERACAAQEAGMPDPSLDEAEQMLLAAMAAYTRMLAERGLVEPGEAAALLAASSDEVFSQPVQVRMAEAAPLDWQQQAFFAGCTAIDLDIHEAEGAAGIGKVPSGTALRFAYPSGPSAQAALVADIVRERLRSVSANALAVGAIPVVIACKDPLALHRAIEPALTQDGATVAVQGRVAFATTDFGRAFLSMHRCVVADPWDPATLTDVLLSPFSGMSRRDAYEMDRLLRRDRTADRTVALASLRVASESFSQLEELASDPDADVLIGVFEQMAQARADRSPAWRAEQLAALAALRKVTAAARAAGQPMEACIEELSDAMVPVTFRSAVETGAAGAVASQAVPDVLIATQADAAALGPGACDTLIATDLTSDDYPVADREDAASTLLGRLGLEAFDNALAETRRRFTALMHLPAAQLVLMRPLNDCNAEPAYACLALEELIDAYRPDPTATREVDNPFRLPAELQTGLLARSEDALYENACALPIGARQQGVPGAAAGAAMAGAVLLPRRTSGGAVLPRACPSPSAIESYLECPQKWFIERRLDARELDEGFGPLEKGSFAHSALQTFYGRFRELGFSKVNTENLPEAQACMEAVLDELESAQAAYEPGENRLIPVDELERREMAALKRRLTDYLSFEAQLLPTFHPAFLEYHIDPDHAAGYAGFNLTGIVDRIDVDDAGHAVIIDYKGSVTDAHAIAGKTPAQMGKVQTRMYARAVERALGLNVVAALYVTYGADPRVSGAYDPTVLDAVHLPGARAESCACAAVDADAVEGDLPGDLLNADLPDDLDFSTLTFSHMLDATEHVVGRAIAAMQAGRVEPLPATPEACSYCIAPDCRRRGDA